MIDLCAHTELLVVAGSRAYGMHRPDSDVDVRGVLVAPRGTYHGILDRIEQVDAPAEIAVLAPWLRPEEREVVAATKLEGTVFEVRKFVTLTGESNPNLLDVLFCRDDEVRHVTSAGQRLRAQRNLFLSRKVRYTFAGYAAAQLRRIEGHRKWLLDPPVAPPERAAYGLPQTTLLPADQLGAAMATVRKQIDRWELDLANVPEATILHVQEQVARALGEVRVALGFDSVDQAKFVAAGRTVGLDDNLVEVMQRERAYEAAARHWRQYREWQTQRNPARAALEAAHGYDTKHAAHLVRLLRMGAEILRTGEVHVWRGPGGADDAHELLAIRAGEWRYDDLVGWATSQDRVLDALAAASPLPKVPDRQALHALCVELVESRLASEPSAP
jgi:predicted nucleotidyltransferase